MWRASKSRHASRSTSLFLALSALFVAVAGALPHAAFSFQTGGLHAFKSAYDEDIYADLSVNGPLLPFRAVSSLAYKTLYLACGGSMESALVVSDIVFPALSTLLAAATACLFANQTAVRAVLLFLFLFGQEVLSFGCTVFVPGGVEAVRPLLRHDFQTLIPYFETSFLSLFRTPDPQVSWILMWAFLALLASSLRKPPGQIGWSALFLLAAVSMTFPFCYLFIGLPLLVLELASGVLLWLTGRSRLAAVLILCASAGGVMATIVHATSKASAERYSLAFASHTPSLTVSALLSVVLLATCTLACMREPSAPRIAALPFVAAPALLMNQQVLTGIMLAGGNWERYFNFPSLLFGAGLFFSAPAACRVAERRIPRLAAPAVLLLMAAGIAAGQVRAYLAWRESNERSLAMARALTSLPPESSRRLTVAIEPPELAPLVALRIRHRYPVLLSYADTVRNRIANLGASDSIPEGRSLHQARLFEFFARTGRSAEDVRSILCEEAGGRSFYYLAYLFSYRDFWPAASHGQAVRQDAFRRQIPGIVRAYEAQLTCPPREWARPMIVVTTGWLAGGGSEGLWRSWVAGSSGSGSYSATAFLQLPSRSTVWQCGTSGSQPE